MNQDIVISAKNLSKIYNLYDRNIDRVKETFHPARKKYHRAFHALKGISFEVKKGEALGIIGRNGSGKSTLLQILCGVLQPTSGSIETSGRIAALLELGAGFNPEFSGRENVYLNGSILGFSQEEMDARFTEIAEFAEIGDFIEQPVKLYSSGMYVRLAFAVQACVEPDILVIDEALAVGDIFFVQKCHERMEVLQANGTTIILVSHGMDAIVKYSTTAMLLDQGHCLFKGQPNEAVERYYHLEQSTHNEIKVNKSENTQKVEPFCELSNQNAIPNWPDEDIFLDISDAVEIGDKDVVRCTKIAICDDDGNSCATFNIGDFAHFYYEIEVLQDIDTPISAVEIYNRMNMVIISKATMHYQLDAPEIVTKGSHLRCYQTIKLLIYPGEYTIVIPFSTVKAKVYSYIGEMTHGQFESQIQVQYRLRRFGVIYVKGHSWAIKDIPFLGMVNLEGVSALEVIEH
ncbi:ABC transporter ATP-binding protein [Desulfococcaceae bacterium HSG7]|nr:ABC transporter ATP-binding protein [Desulfococcaceae bacterium HSG7]